MHIEDDSICRQGTAPKCQQTMSPIDLFHFHEPTNNKQQPALDYDLNSCTKFSLAVENYDLSSVVGNGVCTYAVYTAPSTFLELQTTGKQVGGKFGTSVFDCANINAAVNQNDGYVKKIMKYTHQPHSSLRTFQDLISDFGVWSVIHNLIKSADFRSRRSMVENPYPRVLSCSSSIGDDICQKAYKVPSSEGYSIALNSDFGSLDLGKEYNFTETLLKKVNLVT